MKLKQAILKSVYLYPTILAVFMLMISGINAFAQDKSDKIKITGTVYDETKQPLAGASVREERTSNGTITDQDGNFTIYVKKGSTIRISFLGLESKVMTANIAGKFDIMLKDNTKELGQVVVTGYGKTTKDRVTGSVGIVTAKDLKGSPTSRETGWRQRTSRFRSSGRIFHDPHTRNKVIDKRKRRSALGYRRSSLAT